MSGPLAVLLLCSTALTACVGGGGGGGPLGNLDWDLRNGGAYSTADAARNASDARPTPDSRGVISYPNYQVAVAQQGDTVETLAARVGLGGAELAQYNALTPGDTLRAGEVLALPRRVDGGGSTIAAGSVASAPLDVTAIASSAITRAEGSGGGTVVAGPATRSPAPATGASAPARHQVKRGETAYTIARDYNVSAKDLADWNGLGPDLSVREGQYLIIPTANGAPPVDVTPPGAGSPTPVPPSLDKPLPKETAKTVTPPPSPDLGSQRSAASNATFVMPVSGNVIRPYAKGKNEGIDIAASAGTPVKAAAAGTVAVVTQDTQQKPIIILRHDGGLLTVYGGVAGVTVKKGDTVKRGQTIATVRSGDPAFLHFEVRRGTDSTDPMPYLQ